MLSGSVERAWAMAVAAGASTVAAGAALATAISGTRAAGSAIAVATVAARRGASMFARRAFGWCWQFEPCIFGVCADEGAPDELFNVGNVEGILFIGEADGDAAVSRAPRSPDAVNVVFGVVGEIVVHDVCDVVHVDTAPGDVGCDHDVDFAGAKAFECFDALLLGNCAGEEGAVDAIEAESVEEAFGVVAAIDEADHATRVFAVQDIVEEGELLVGGDDVDDLFDCIHGNAFGFDNDGGRVARPRGRQAADVVAEGCAEKEGLSLILMRSGVHDGADIGDEAHVQHAIRLIKDEDFDIAQVEVAASFEVNEAAGRCGNDVHTLGVKLRLLFLVVHSAEDGDCVDSCVGAELGGVLMDLNAELAGGSEDECAGVSRFARLGVGVAQNAVENGEKEGRCFAGTRLALAERIASFQRLGENAGLDWRAIGELQIGDAVQDFIRQVQIVEAQFSFRRWHLE